MGSVARPVSIGFTISSPSQRAAADKQMTTWPGLSLGLILHSQKLDGDVANKGFLVP